MLISSGDTGCVITEVANIHGKGYTDNNLVKTDGNGFVNVIMMCLIPKLSVPCFAQIDNEIYF